MQCTGKRWLLSATATLGVAGGANTNSLMAGSGSDKLAFLGAGGTGLSATFAGLVLVGVLFTFFFAVETGVQRHACKLRQVFGVLISEVLQRATQREHLRNALGARGQLFLTVAHQIKTMIQAGLAGTYARSRRVRESLVVGAVMYVSTFFSRRHLRSRQAGQGQQSRSHHSFSSIHGKLLPCGTVSNEGDRAVDPGSLGGESNAWISQLTLARREISVRAHSVPARET